MKVQLVYPVIIISKKESMIYVYFNDRSLKSTSEELLKKIDYTSLEIIDALGHKYKINKAFKVKHLGLWGFNPLLKGRQIQIDFEYWPEIETVPLRKFKEDIINRLERKRKFWELTWNFEELKKKVDQSQNFEEIAYLLK